MIKELTGLFKTTESENLVDKVINLGQMFSQIKGRDLTKDDLLDLFKQDKYKALTDLDKNKIFEHFNLKQKKRIL